MKTRIVWDKLLGGPLAGQHASETPEDQWQRMYSVPRQEYVGDDDHAPDYIDRGGRDTREHSDNTEIYQLQPVCSSHEPHILAWVHYLADVPSEISQVWAELCRLIELGQKMDDIQRRHEEGLCAEHDSEHRVLDGAGQSTTLRPWP